MPDLRNHIFNYFLMYSVAFLLSATFHRLPHKPKLYICRVQDPAVINLELLSPLTHIPKLYICRDQNPAIINLAGRDGRIVDSLSPRRRTSAMRQRQVIGGMWRRQ